MQEGKKEKHKQEIKKVIIETSNKIANKRDKLNTVEEQKKGRDDKEGSRRQQKRSEQESVQEQKDVKDFKDSRRYSKDKRRQRKTVNTVEKLKNVEDMKRKMTILGERCKNRKQHSNIQ